VVRKNIKTKEERKHLARFLNGRRRRGGTTPVAMERVRKSLKIEEIVGCRCAKECATS
jgi:hypothetical protein